MNDIQFEVGQQYENRKGTYEVVSIDGDEMVIRWEGGEDASTTVTMQGRILKHMRRGLQQSPTAKGGSQPGREITPTGWTITRRNVTHQ